MNRAIVGLAVIGAALGGAVLLTQLGTDEAAAEQRMLVRLSTNPAEAPVGWPTWSGPTNNTDSPPGFTNMTWNELLAYREGRMMAYQVWLDAKLSVDEKPLRDNIQAIKDLYSTLEQIQEGWQQGTNYNAAQLQQILEQHNKVLLRLRPILQDLYNGE